MQWLRRRRKAEKTPSFPDIGLSIFSAKSPLLQLTILVIGASPEPRPLQKAEILFGYWFIS
jgi:hypothetical protein